MIELTECPECGAVWGLEEIDFQECDCCGWPDDEAVKDFQGHEKYWLHEPDRAEDELDERWEKEGWE